MPPILRRALLGAALVVALAGLSAPATAQSHPPGSFVVSAAEEALAGDIDGVLEFVIWEETEQGAAFWSAEAERVAAGGVLSPKAAEIVGDWLAAAEASVASPVPQTYVSFAGVLALEGDPDALLGFVTWSDTPQGHAYWSAQYDYAVERGAIYPLAQRIIENWMALSDG